jgi:hypothetical protein
MTTTDTAAPSIAVWTLTLDFQDTIVTTVHADEAEVYGTLRDIFGEDREDELPEDDGALVDYLTKPSWEGGIGAVFYIERHTVDCPREGQPGRESVK